SLASGVRKLAPIPKQMRKSACFTEVRYRIGRQSSDLLHPTSDLRHPSFADLVVIARSLYPIPSRTRPSKSSAPMVLNLKVWKSRSLPGLPRTEHPLTIFKQK